MPDGCTYIGLSRKLIHTKILSIQASSFEQRWPTYLFKKKKKKSLFSIFLSKIVRWRSQSCTPHVNLQLSNFFFKKMAQFLVELCRLIKNICYGNRGTTLVYFKLCGTTGLKPATTSISDNIIRKKDWRSLTMDVYWGKNMVKWKYINIVSLIEARKSNFTALNLA